MTPSTIKRWSKLSAFVVAMSVLGSLSCKPERGGTGPSVEPLAQLDISPKSALVRVNQLRDVLVVGLTAGGDTAEIDVSFHVRGTAGGTISGSNSGRGRALGHYRAGNATGRDTVVATDTSGMTASAFVDVTQMPVSSVTLSPPSALVRVGGSTTFTATTWDSTGTVLTGRAISWVSTNSGVASVDASGAVSASAVGTTSVIASSEGTSDTAVVTVTLVPVATMTVTPPSATIMVGQTAPLTATTRDSAGAILTGRAITWSSTATGVATVNSSGVATAVSAGSASIIATSEDKSDTAVVTVTTVPVASVTVTPPSAAVFVGATAQFTATTRDSAGNFQTDRVITWVSTAPAVATVTAAGLARGIAAGSASIIATSEGQSDTSVVTVTVPVASVTVTPASASVFVGATAQFTATTHDSAGDLLTGRVITWVSTAPAVATVTAAGLARGIAGGSASIIATSEGQSDTSVVTVTVPVASVTVTPASASVLVSATTQFTATTLDSAGNVLIGRVISWSSTATGVATVDGTGLATGVSAGSASIIATNEGRSDTSLVTVIVPVASVTVSPATPSVDVGATRSFSATTRDSAGNVLTDRVINWSSTAIAIATVNGTGVATGVAAGLASIIATSEGRADTASLTVTLPGAVAEPTLLPQATGQVPLADSYGRSLAAGDTYVDPNSGITVLKLTSASVPEANGGMYHGYSEGGPNISQPWTDTDGETYYTVKVDTWLVDIQYGTLTPSNWRHVDAESEIGLAFSLNPATPRIAYIITDWLTKQVERYNTATNQIENTGNWPWVPSAPGEYLTWLQVNLNDDWIVAMLNSNRTTVAFQPSTGTQRSILDTAHGLTVDEPHLDREFPVVYFTSDGALRQVSMNLVTEVFTDPNDPDSIVQDSHTATLRGKAVAQGHWAADAIVSVDRFGNVAKVVTPTPTDVNGDYHLAGQWVFNNPNEYFVLDQWAGNGANAIRRGMIGFASTGGDVRLIAASDAVGTGYGTGGQPHPTLSPDGKLVMWVSNMNGSARYDTFIARVPVR